MDPNAIDELFERNADMRLLEFRHAEPGKGAPPNNPIRTSSFSNESIVSAVPDAVIEKAARMRVSIAAAPASGVIPGAVVGVAIDVFNDGTGPAPESKLVVSTPLESEFRVGTLRVDGREVQAPEQLFNRGLPIARLQGATSSKVTFQLAILPGVNALYLQPRLQTNGVPVVGTAGVAIKRLATSAPIEPARPFYELDEEETAEVAAESAEPIMPPLLHIAPPEPQVETPPPELLVAAVPVPEVVAAIAAPEPEIVAPEPEIQVPEPEARKKPVLPAPNAPLGSNVVPEERMIRYRTLGSNDIALLDRLFATESPSIIAHYILISSIACTEPGSGEDASGYMPFLRRDIELLGRALVHARMGKAPQYRVSQADLDALALPWSLTPQQAFPPQRRLRRDLRKSEWAAIGGLTQPSERDATLRTRIALLALAGATLDGVERRAAEECASALTAYRAAALAWLVPLCVASAGADAFVIPNPPAKIDEAGRRAVAAIKTALRS
jgi:hypothetical protein